MPESRDRLSRPEDIAELFARRRSNILGILADEPEGNSNLFGPPVRRETTTTTVGARGGTGMMALRGGGVGRAGFGNPRNDSGLGRGRGRGRAVHRSPMFGRENTPATGSGWRGRGRSPLPAWYPRTPLRDITHVVRAIERRRSRLREIEGQQIDTPHQEHDVDGDSTLSPAGAQLEHDISMISPSPTTGVQFCPKTVGKLPKILLDIVDQKGGESEVLTPQKKLLNSIDTVEKAVTEEFRKLKRTPVAKKAEREKRIRTLMTMR